ncbi:LysR substrate-binding domain-containing protein, partial [Pseudomonas sp. MOB-449]|nr:LysR substrate-binding domain-containing protein [Pseudomonas sp. MOB-449]
SAVVRAVADGRADVGIVAAQTSVDGLETARYREDHLTVVLAATHALANRSSLTWSEVLEHELVGPHRESSVYALLSKEAEALGKSLNLRIRI